MNSQAVEVVKDIPTYPVHYKPRDKDSDGKAKKNDDRPTPRDLFESLNAEFRFRVDACASKANRKVRAYFDEAADGLNQDWLPWRRIWCNPPYGDAIPVWIEKAAREAARGATVVMLIPASTSTKWFAELAFGKCEIRFIQSKIQFVGQASAAPFHSMVLVFGPKVKPILRYMEKRTVKDHHIKKRSRSNTNIRYWVTLDYDGSIHFDPLAHCGGWLHWRLRMINDIIYFGCRRSMGHYFHPSDPGQSHKKEIFVSDPRFEAACYGFDGAYCAPLAGSKYYPDEGAVRWVYIQELDTTIMAWIDQSVDDRPGSNSAVVALGLYQFEELAAELERLWPDVASRQRQPLRLAEELNFETLRDAWLWRPDKKIQISRDLANPASELSIMLAGIKSRQPLAK